MSNELHVYLYRYVKKINQEHEYQPVDQNQIIYSRTIILLNNQENWIHTLFVDHEYYQHDFVNIAPFQRIIKQMYLNLPKEKYNELFLILYYRD